MKFTIVIQTWQHHYSRTFDLPEEAYIDRVMIMPHAHKRLMRYKEVERFFFAYWDIFALVRMTKDEKIHDG